MHRDALFSIMMAMTELLQTCPVKIDVPVAWGEMDAYQHVNNIVYFRYFESARMAYFEKIGYTKLMLEQGLGPILASTQCRFKHPLTYPDCVTITTRISELRKDRFVMNYSAFSHKSQRVAAEGQGLVVSYDYQKLTKIDLPDLIRQNIIALESRFGNKSLATEGVP